MFFQKLPRFSKQSLSLLTRPQRAADILEEHCFVRQWLMKCATDNSFLPTLLSTGGALSVNEPTNQRVAASIIQWLGTSCGNSFLLEAQDYLGSGDPKLLPEAFTLCWQQVNSPEKHINFGYGALQWIMDEHDPQDEFLFAQRLNNPGNPTLISPLTKRDYRIAEVIVRWLGTQDGQDFIKLCESTIKKGQRQQGEDFHATWNLGILAPA